MPKPLPRREVIARILKAGGSFLREGAGHSIYLCACGKHRLVIPRHNEISAGVVGNLQRAALECHGTGWMQ